MKPRTRGLAIAAALLVLAAAAVYGAGGVELSDLLDWFATIPDWVLVLVVFAAPLAAVPLSLLLLVVGANFSLATGLVLVLAVLAVHHLLLYGLTRSGASVRLRRQLAQRKLIARPGQRRRLIDDALLVTMATWAPGLSYVFKVALTALAGMPFRTYFVLGVLSQTVAALPYLLLGDFARNAPFAWIGAGVFAVALLSWAMKRLLFRKPGPMSSDRL